MILQKIVEKYHSSSNRRVAVVLPAYNEAERIGAVLSQLVKLPFIVIVVDDGSHDATAKIALSYPEVRVISRNKRGGKGAALRDGVNIALEHGVSAVIFADADGQHAVQDIEKLFMAWKEEHHDVILGVRDLKHPAMPFLRKLSNRFTTALVGFCAARPFTDTQCGLRLFSKRVVGTLSFTAHGYTFETMTLFEVLDNNFATREIPVATIYDPERRFPFFGRLNLASTVLVAVFVGGTRHMVRRFFSGRKGIET